MSTESGISRPLVPPADRSEKRTADRVVYLDKARVVGISEDDEAFYRGFSKARRRQVRSKIDMRLLPMLCVLYLFAQLDRSNIGNAKIEGLKEDTGLTDGQFNIILAAFFIPYCLFEVPSNMILKRLERPSRYLAVLVLAWGIVMTCHGFVRNFPSLLVMRLLLGITESGFYPAATFLCSQWYQPHELAFRLSLFMAVSAISGVASGVLAAAIANMDGLCGYEGWRWLFIVEGAATVTVGFTTLFLLVDSPAHSTAWLSAEEIRYLEIQALVKEGGTVREGHRPSKLKDFKAIVSNWRYWAFGIIFHVNDACGYGLKLTMPGIIRAMGYSKSHSQLLSAIPYAFGLVSALAAAFGSDVLACRSIFVVGGFTSVIVGLAIILGLVHDLEANRIAIIAGMCFITGGTFPINPTGGGWASNNIVSSSRRAMGLGFVLSIGSLGGLTGALTYMESQTPYFSLGFNLSCGLSCLGLTLALLLVASFWYENRKRAAVDAGEVQERYTEKELHELGEASPLFRFTL
ncbi:MFS-type transporter cnsO [Paramyrothecium foliicola]|nr:MFS-type transporter cnsO [Paramyrothecium foliicola]